MRPLPPIRRSRVAGPGVPLALAIAAAVAFGACGPRPYDPDQRPSAVSSIGPGPASEPPSAGTPGRAEGTAGLWLLVGSPGAMRLVRSGGEQSDLAPDPAAAGLPTDVRWASGDADRGFVATIGASGRILTLGPTRAGSGSHPSGWQRLSVRPSAGSSLGSSPSFAALSPDGRSIAATVGDPTSGATDAGLLLVGRASGQATSATLDGRLDGHPPAWLGNATVAVPILDRADAATMAVLDRATGRTAHRQGLGGSLAASADGRLISMSSRAGDRVVVGPSTGLGGSEGWIEVVGPGGSPDPNDRVAQVLLDAPGTRLAVAWLDAAGEASTVTVYRTVDSGWRPAGTIAPTSGATRVVLVGFDP
ncbi:MAG: hypothetical protein ACHQ3P_01155 [Candidatus Limnocylindrales bacterium]